MRIVTPRNYQESVDIPKLQIVTLGDVRRFISENKERIEAVLRGLEQFPDRAMTQSDERPKRDPKDSLLLARLEIIEHASSILSDFATSAFSDATLLNEFQFVQWRNLKGNLSDKLIADDLVGQGMIVQRKG